MLRVSFNLSTKITIYFSTPLRDAKLNLIRSEINDTYLFGMKLGYNKKNHLDYLNVCHTSTLNVRIYYSK